MKAKLIFSMIAMSAVSLTAAAEDFSWGNVIFQPRVYAVSYTHLDVYKRQGIATTSRSTIDAGAEQL